MARISRNIGIAVLVVLAMNMLATTAAMAGGKPGDAGLLFLRMPVGARESAMGGTGVASSNGAAAIFWNPANLVFSEMQTELLLQHQRMFSLFSKETAILAHKTSLGVFGISFTGFYSDAIDRRTTSQVDVFDGTFKPYDVSIGATYARELAESIAVGVTAKFVYERIFTYNDSGLAFDFFVSHESMVEGLRFGASYTNIGQQITLKDQPFDLPRAFRIGAAFDPPQSFLADKVTLAADVISPNDGNSKAHVGAEYRPLPELALRSGSSVNYDSRGLTFGAGFRVRNLDLGYAFEDYSNGLEPTHKISLQFIY